MKKIIICLIGAIVLYSCSTSKPSFTIKQDYVDFYVYQGDSLIGKIPWPAYLIHGKDTLKLNGELLHKTF